MRFISNEKKNENCSIPFRENLSIIYVRVKMKERWNENQYNQFICLSYFCIFEPNLRVSSEKSTFIHVNIYALKNLSISEKCFFIFRSKHHINEEWRTRKTRPKIIIIRSDSYFVIRGYRKLREIQGKKYK